MSLGKSKILSQGGAAVPVGTDNFNTVLYTGNSSTQSITGVGFQPDFVWIKTRSAGSTNHVLYDSIRGAGNLLVADNSQAEASISNGLTSFNSNGFSLGNEIYNHNNNGSTYVAWCWKAGGAAVTNTDGTITSQVSANTEAGFSIATYAGNSTQNATIGHGLTSPKLTIVKNRSQPDAWFVGSTLLGTNEFLELNESYAKTTNSDLNYQILSTTFKTTSSSPHDMINQSGENYVMYTFADVDGYQKIGSYSGSNSDLQVDTGFQPRFLMLKNIDASGRPWVMIDSLRTGYLEANSIAAEADTISNYVTFNSQGFLLVGGTGSYMNESGWDFLYLAIA